jgi:hypothetical protein
MSDIVVAAPPRIVVVQAWDIETTGSRLPGGGDEMFAVGSAMLRVNLDTGAVERVASRRWVLQIAAAGLSPGALRALWEDRGYDLKCFDEFWSKNLPVFNAMMMMTADMYPTRQAMADSIAAYIGQMEAAHPHYVRVYDTVGFDVTNIEALLVAYGHRSLFLSAQGWPCYPGYLGDVTRAALRISPLERILGISAAQRAAIDAHNKQALPEGLAHTHDPADDALCIAYKWTHYALLEHRRAQTA